MMVHFLSEAGVDYKNGIYESTRFNYIDAVQVGMMDQNVLRHIRKYTFKLAIMLADSKVI